eukprot:TRINITY_DN9376_c0_g1_i2.p1 TRINITY_DN9376_c0_g1~~TRINITY_DN9376_c0_g1_i2.p1  ORF type:complete len:444 (+),score=65.32 TRINITY_DN9376_c0_g1_i2:58-1389(+)
MTSSANSVECLDTSTTASSSSACSSTADPRSVGVDPAMLREYDKAMRRAVAKGLLPGCADVVLRSGQVVHRGRYGYADTDTDLRFDEETICRVYCFTKAYTIVVFMTLVDEGLAKLTDPLSKYIKGFRDVRVVGARGGLLKPKRRITLEDLLLHKSGLQYSAGFGEQPHSEAEKSYAGLVSGVVQGQIRSLRAFVNRLARLPLRFHPGERYEYGYSTDVLARVIEVIMRKPLEQCMQEKLFEPLGMLDTSFSVPDSKLSRLAACYGSASTWGSLHGDDASAVPHTVRNGLVRLDGCDAKQSAWRRGKHCPVASGGGWMPDNQGGLVSTIADTVRFLRMMLNYGLGDNGVRILQAKTVRLTEKKYITGDGGLSGFEIGHGGAACTYWTIDRKTDYAIVWFTQHTDLQEWADQTTVDPKKADLWNVMFEATRASHGLKRKRSQPS